MAVTLVDFLNPEPRYEVVILWLDLNRFHKRHDQFIGLIPAGG
jgi:hypothetical protein